MKPDFIQLNRLIMPQFIYVIDPMCSWCWAFQPVIKTLKNQFPDFDWLYLMGGLAPDSEHPMPAEQQQQIQSIWKHIEQQTGTRFNHDFWTKNTPRRSTYPACRAVISAEKMHQGCGIKMIEAIQKAYYLDAKNPSEPNVLLQLASELNLNGEKFSQLLNSNEINEALEKEISYSHKLGAQGFPSLFMKRNNTIYPLAYGFSSADKMIIRVEEYLAETE